MRENEREPKASSLLALGDLSTRPHWVERPEIKAICDWLTGHESPALWVSGPRTSGRTAAVAKAIRDAAPPLAQRVLCVPGSSFEEVLDKINYLLQQVGNQALTLVLDQRAGLRSKIAVLFQALRDLPLVLWLDDFDN